MKTKARQILFNILMVALFVGLMLFIVYGCAPRGSVPPAPGISGGPASVLARVGLIASGLGATGLVLCVLAAWFWPNKFTVAKAAIGCAGLIAIGAILYHLALHLGLYVGISLVGAVLAGAWRAHRHVGYLERKTGIDLDRNGKIG